MWGSVGTRSASSLVFLATLPLDCFCTAKRSYSFGCCLPRLLLSARQTRTLRILSLEVKAGSSPAPRREQNILGRLNESRRARRGKRCSGGGGFPPGLPSQKLNEPPPTKSVF